MVVWCQDKRGATPLYRAAAQGLLEAAAALLAGGANPNEKDKYGTTGRGWMCARHEVGWSSLYSLVRGAFYTAGNTALHAACEENREAMAVMLLENGARTNVRNAEGKRPLELARTGLRATLTSLKK